jgi:hypothetical protein
VAGQMPYGVVCVVVRDFLVLGGGVLGVVAGPLGGA